MGLSGEARERFRLTTALGPWGCGLQRREPNGGRVAGPRPLEHDAQPHQGNQHQLVEKERRDHSNTPSYKSANEGIVPGLSGCRISRKLEVQDPMAQRALLGY